MGKLSCHELKIPKIVHFTSAFQNGRFVFSPRITIGGKLHVRAGYEKCLCFNFTLSFIKELCLIFMVRESLRVSLLMFRIETSAKKLYQIAENTNACTEEDKYLDSIYLNDILVMGQAMEEILVSRDTLKFHLKHLDFVLKLKKSILDLQFGKWSSLV